MVNLADFIDDYESSMGSATRNFAKITTWMAITMQL